MPFTLSHPAAAVPLARPLRLPLSALWVGSLSPDFIYFLRLRATGEFGHSLGGLFWFCLPLSLLLLWLWHAVMKAPAAALLPVWAGRRAAAAALAPFAFGPGPRLARVGAGVLVGALTHDAWDAFTHTDGWVAERWPLLMREAQVLGFGPLPWCRWLQLLSTAVGGLLLAWWAWRWLRRQPVGAALPLPGRGLWVAALLLGAVALGAASGRLQSPPLLTREAIRWFVVQSLVGTCSMLWLGLMLFGLWYRRQQQKAGPAEAEPAGSRA